VSGSSSVPNIEFTPEGLVLPSDQDILAGVQADQNAAFGLQLNPALETPQGQLASSTAAIISDKNATIAELVAQVDPDLADGFMQDAIGRIYFLNRNPAVPTNVECQVGGVAGTVIPAGSLAIDTSGSIYASTGAVTLGIDGTATANFANVVTGAIACPSGTLNQIYRAVIGWETIDNADDGVLGRPIESRAEFEYRRRQSVALNAHGTVQAIYAAVFDIDGVSDAYVIDNPSNVAVTRGSTNYELAANSVYVAVVGGDDQEIAETIWTKKDLGCSYNGDTEVTVYDTTYDFPYPEYVVKFQRADPTPVLFNVKIARNTALPFNIQQLVKNAIIAGFTGSDGGSRARIGGNILASRYYGIISAISPIVQILEILVGITTATNNLISIGIDQAPTIDESDIVVEII
jgi:hypothetical protein